MSPSPLPAPALEAMRTIGDPEIERLKLSDVELQQYAIAVHTRGLHGVAPTLVKDHEKIAGVVNTTHVEQDNDMLREAQRLFTRYGTEISGALLLAALPQSYATELGARTLVASAGLDANLVRRIRHTALFLMFVMQRPERHKPGEEDDSIRHLWLPPTDDTDTPVSWKLCAALRLYHHATRRRIQQEAAEQHKQEERPRKRAKQTVQTLEQSPQPGTPLNQEDLLGMLLTFTISVFEVLERYGICWTADEQEAYLHAWDVIGDHLGIGTPAVKVELQKKVAGVDDVTAGWHGLRPGTVEETRALLGQIRDRHWIDPGPTSAPDSGPASGQRAGRLLTSALLDELSTAMPPTLKLLPITVMRTLAPDVVRKRLSLGHNGIVIRALGQLPKRRSVIGRFTAVNTPNPIFARVLRSMANEVTSRASIHFLKEADYFIPGLPEDWSRGIDGGR